MQLQGVVYIAHGWCLAMTSEALARDRPEAMGFGHEYQRLAEALASYGAAPLSRLVSEADTVAGGATAPARANFTKMERGLIASIFSQYADLPASRMAILTRAPGSACEKIYANGGGLSCEIPHSVVRAQFLQLVDDFPRTEASLDRLGE